MLPVQLPLHEPYFDFTLISDIHAKIYGVRRYLFVQDLKPIKANLLYIHLSACDEWLVPIRAIFTVTLVIHDY